jgi:hypothetical protein
MPPGPRWISRRSPPWRQRCSSPWPPSPTGSRLLWSPTGRRLLRRPGACHPGSAVPGRRRPRARWLKHTRPLSWHSSWTLRLQRSGPKAGPGWEQWSLTALLSEEARPCPLPAETGPRRRKASGSCGRSWYEDASPGWIRNALERSFQASLRQVFLLKCSSSAQRA